MSPLPEIAAAMLRILTQKAAERARVNRFVHRRAGITKTRAS